MKKILILLSVLFLCNINNLTAATIADKDQDGEAESWDEEIALGNISGSSGTGSIGPVSLPLFPDVEAWKGSVITVKFNRNLGDATVVIYDANGYEVDYVYYDTSFTGKVTLGLPTVAGSYRLHITTANGAKEGYFNVL